MTMSDYDAAVLGTMRELYPDQVDPHWCHDVAMRIYAKRQTGDWTTLVERVTRNVVAMAKAHLYMARF